MSTLIAASRPTRRDVRRHPGRILAAVLLITIPVWLLAHVLVTTQSADVPNKELHSSHQVRWTGQGEPPALTPLLPDGFTAVKLAQGVIRLDGQDLTVGESTRVSGNDVLLPRGERDLLGVERGDTLASETTTFTYAGPTPGYYPLVAPGQLTPSDDADTWWSITGPTTLDDEQIRRLEDAGFSYSGRWDAMGPDIYLVLAVASSVISMLAGAVILLTLLAPAFTTSVSRQTRNFALMASQGATPRQLFASVLTYGLIAGLIGSSLGVAGGMVTAWFHWRLNYPGWPVTVAWWHVPLLWVAGVAAATVAAWLPAWIVSRTSITQGLQGATNDRMMSWRRWMLVGPVLLTVALASCAVALLLPEQLWPVFELLMACAQLCGLLGVVLSAPAVVFLAGHFTGPLSVTLALRDLRRQSLRSVPAVAAIALIASGMTFLVSMGETQDRHTRETYAESYADGTFTVNTAQLEPGSVLDEKRIRTEIEDILGPVRWGTVEGITAGPDTYRYLSFSDIDLSGGCSDQHCLFSGQSSTLFEGNFTGSTVIATPDVLRAMRVDPALADSEQVLVSSRLEMDSADFRITSYSDHGTEETLGESLTLPVASVLPGPQQSLLPTRAVMERLGVHTDQLGLVGTANHQITEQQARELEELSAVGSVQSLRGSDSRLDLLLQTAGTTAALILLATLVLTLSRGPARRQKTLLDAVGAPPGLTGRYFAFYGGAITVLGGLLGVVAGHAAEFVLSDPGARSAFVPVWYLTAAVLIIAPLASAGIGFLLAPRGLDHEPLPDRA